MSTRPAAQKPGSSPFLEPMRRTFFWESPCRGSHRDQRPLTSHHYSLPYVLAEEHKSLVHGDGDAVDLLLDLKGVAHVEVELGLVGYVSKQLLTTLSEQLLTSNDKASRTFLSVGSIDTNETLPMEAVLMIS